MDQEYVTVDEVAARLRVDAETVRRWLRSGRLPGVLISRQAGYRIRRDDVAAFVERRGLGESHEPVDYRRKLDCLLAAVLERPESAAILARAEAIERGDG